MIITLTCSENTTQRHPIPLWGKYRVYYLGTIGRYSNTSREEYVPFISDKLRLQSKTVVDRTKSYGQQATVVFRGIQTLSCNSPAMASPLDLGEYHLDGQIDCTIITSGSGNLARYALYVLDVYPIED